MIQRKWSVIVLMTLFSMWAQAQRVLTLDDVFTLAAEHNMTIAVAERNLSEQSEAVKVAQADRLPDIGASATVGYLGNGLITDRDFSHSFTAHIPHFGTSFAIEARQLIYSGGAVSGAIKAAELGQELAQWQLQQRTQEVRFLLTGYYLDLYRLLCEERVIDNSIELANRLIDHITLRQAEGTALRNDITRYELRKQDLLLRKEQVRNSRSIVNRQLNTALGLPPAEVILPDTTAISPAQAFLTEEMWQQKALLGAPVMHVAQTQVDLAAEQLHISKAYRKPHFALFAQEALNGPVTIDIPAMNKNFNFWQVGVGVSYDVSSLFKANRRIRKHALAVDKARTEQQLAAQQLGNSVQQAYVLLGQAHTEMATCEKSLQLATQNYDVVRKRYINDLALLTDMLDADQQRLTADIDVVKARIAMAYRYYTLLYICGEI